MLHEKFAVLLISLYFTTWILAIGLLIFLIRMVSRFVNAHERLARAAEQIATHQSVPIARPIDHRDQ